MNDSTFTGASTSDAGDLQNLREMMVKLPMPEKQLELLITTNAIWRVLYDHCQKDLNQPDPDATPATLLGLPIRACPSRAEAIALALRMREEGRRCMLCIEDVEDVNRFDQIILDQRDMPPDFSQVITDNFKDLLEPPTR